MGKIRVAIAGVGNCASSLIQGCVYYTNKDNTVVGLLHAEFGGYHVSDIEFVAAFDVDKRKVGNDLSVAINAGSNCTKEICDVSVTGVIVQKAPVLDGVADHMRQTFLVDESQKECDVIGELERSGADMLICYLPVGSAKAARFYADRKSVV